MVQRFIASEHGVSLIENLVSLFLGSVIIVAVYGFYRMQLIQTMTQETKTATLEDSRGALDIIIRDLKNAGAWADGIPPAEVGGADDPNEDFDTICNRVYLAGPDKIHVQMDLNGNGNCSDSEPRENVRYELTGPTSTCKGNKIIRRNGDCLVPNVTTPVEGVLFTYFDESGSQLGAYPPVDAIKRIRISFAVRAKNPDPKAKATVTSQLTSSVNLRNYR
jgi:type II secretory pathway component PulJ